jgi:antitoxin component of RelBE/YafQ-DinJ toxin-antitoxin module
MNTTKDKLFTAKVEENLLDAFKSACENQDTTASQAVRAFMRDYAKKHGQADLFSTKKAKK